MTTQTNQGETARETAFLNQQDCFNNTQTEQESKGSSLIRLYKPYVSCNAFEHIVQGDSVSPKLVDGDIVAVEPELSPIEGDYVVAEIAGDVIIRQMTKKADEWWLAPTNQAYAGMETPVSEANIMGVVNYILPPLTILRRPVASDGSTGGEA